MARTHSNREAIGASLRFDVLTRCNYACYYCGVPASMGMKVLHIDHVIPVDLGGTNDPWNLVAACWDCNGGKSNVIPPESLIREVREDWRLFNNSRGRNAEYCTVCHIPIWTDDGDDPSDECGACNEIVCNANEAGWRSGWDYGYEKGRAEAIKSFTDYVFKQQQAGGPQ